MTHTDSDHTPKHAADMLSQRRFRWLPPLTLCTLAVAGVGFYLLGAAPKAQAREQAEQRAQVAATQPRRVIAATVRLADETITIRQPATLEPNRRAAILAQVAGYLIERRVEIGDRVQQGQILGVIAAPLVEKELREAQAARAVAQAAVAEALQAEELARRTAQRQVEAASNNAVSKQIVDSAETELRSATAALERSRASVLASDATLARLERQLEFRELRAPFAGVVTRRTREQGDFIEFGGNPTDPAVFTIVDSSTLRTTVNLPQAQAYLVRADQTAKVRIGGATGRVVNARVSRISGEIDPATRTMPVEIEVPNADGSLIPGSYATVEIESRRPADLRPAMIPANALMLLPTNPDGTGGPTVAVITGATSPFTLEYRSVTLGRDMGSEIEITSGLAAGDRLALNLPIPLPPQTRVEIATPATPATTPAAATSTPPAVVAPPTTAPAPATPAAATPAPSTPAR
jgi:membrane fusion protein, multidrug efflux system